MDQWVREAVRVFRRNSRRRPAPEWASKITKWFLWWNKFQGPITICRLLHPYWDRWRKKTERECAVHCPFWIFQKRECRKSNCLVEKESTIGRLGRGEKKKRGWEWKRELGCPPITNNVPVVTAIDGIISGRTPPLMGEYTCTCFSIIHYRYVLKIDDVFHHFDWLFLASYWLHAAYVYLCPISLVAAGANRLCFAVWPSQAAQPVRAHHSMQCKTRYIIDSTLAQTPPPLPQSCFRSRRCNSIGREIFISGPVSLSIAKTGIFWVLELILLINFFFKKNWQL